MHLFSNITMISKQHLVEKLKYRVAPMNFANLPITITRQQKSIILPIDHPLCTLNKSNIILACIMSMLPTNPQEKCSTE